MTSPQGEDDSSHLTVRQLAARWKTSPGAIYIARHRGKAPSSLKLGSRVLFPLAEVLKFEAASMANDRLSARRSSAEHRPPEALRARRPRKTAAV